MMEVGGVQASEKQAQRRFAPEFKGQAVKRVLSGHKVAVVAKELGIGESLLHGWVTRHRLSEGGGALQAEQAAEIAQLKRRLAQKEEEAAILKKAMAYLARESRLLQRSQAVLNLKLPVTQRVREAKGPLRNQVSTKRLQDQVDLNHVGELIAPN